MCSYLIIISKKSFTIDELKIANQYISSRGPDQTFLFQQKFKEFNFYSIHNLLDISGRGICQPIKNDESKFLYFNGEIYEPSFEKADTEILNNKFINNELDDFLKHVSGEFCICSIDAFKKEIDIFSDLIKTKPLFYYVNNDFIGISSYKSALENFNLQNIKEFEPNSHYKIDFSEFDNIKLEKKVLYELKLKQYKLSLEDWNRKLLKSISQRISHFKSVPFVPLSSGYDSGLICCALNKLGIKYTSISLGDYEDLKILKKRIKINKKHSCIKHYYLPPLTKDDFYTFSKLIKEKLGEIKYSHLDGDRKKPIFLHEDGGAIGLAKICEFMKKKGFNCLLSGSGADEIISDYGYKGEKLFTHSQFGGLFPQKLEEIFPWKKFYGDTQRSYLNKDEMITGIYGIEGRYPYLDKNLIQEFLSISVDLKNKRYKNCIATFLEENNYPFKEKEKLGFLPTKTRYSIFERIINKFLKIFSLKKEF